MRKRIQNLRKILEPSDGLSIVVIVVGLLIAVFLPDIAIKLIGASVAILGTVALFMMISQRFNNMVDSFGRGSGGKPIPGIKVIEHKDDKAKRGKIDGYQDNFGPAITQSKEQKSDKPRVFSLGDEGFTIISTKSDTKSEKKERSSSNNLNETKNVNEKEGLKEKVTTLIDETKVAVDKPIEPQKDDVTNTVYSQKEAVGSPDNFQTELIEEKATSDDFQQDSESSFLGDEYSGMRIIKKIPVPKSTSEPKITLAIEEQQQVKAQKPDEAKELTENVVNQADSKNIISDASETSSDSTRKKKKEIKSQRFEIIETNEDIDSKPINIPLSMLIDDTKMVFINQPRKEFEYFLSRVLLIIRSIINTRTAAFILLNREKKQMILESFVTDVPEAITKNLKLPLGSDVISSIFHNMAPELLSEINSSAELDLIPYYTKPVGTSSFIGVPVFYENSVIGAVCVDSGEPDCYNELSVGFLGHFTKLISALVVSYTEKYNLLLSAKTLAAINRFRSLMYDKELTAENVFESILESAESLLEYSKAGVCTYDESSGKWYIAKLLSKNDSKIKTPYKEIEMDGSLVSEAILEAKTIFISNLSIKAIRLCRDETGLPGGCFAAAPLKSMEHNYGALFIEATAAMNITKNDIDILETLGEHAGTALEQIHFRSIIAGSKMQDENTGTLNPRAFYSRLEEEFLRANDMKNPLVLCLFTLDKYDSLDPKNFVERYNLAINHILSVFINNLQDYEFIGNLDNGIFGCVFFGKSLEDTRFIVERVRNETVGRAIVFEGRKYHITFSAGVADSRNCKTPNDIMTNSMHALHISRKKTNTVTCFN